MSIRTATNAKHPFDGETNPKYSGPKPPYEFLDVDKKYSWLKSPRYHGKPMEVGPLARMVVGYASGQKEIKAAVDGVLEALQRSGHGAVLHAGPHRGARPRVAD